MKLFIAFSALFVFSQAFAQDMSRTESYRQAYRQNADGSSTYVGGCSLHEAYEDKKFSVTSTIIEYFEPDYQMPQEKILKKLSVMGPQLLEAVMEYIAYDGEIGFDDLTLETIKFKHSSQSFFRFNIGVGGGNGQYLTYLQTQSGFKLVTHTFDGDLEFCDKKVWLK
ncbi:MAG: hypothetical protein LW878_12100 [Proteobacteria bacterium]|jgi:hypothetical protein|nr:hypothetical protein [Pseudomonadota bacterium]